MTNLTPSIAEDIQMLVKFWLDAEKSTPDYRQRLVNAAERVEASLSSKPDHL